MGAANPGMPAFLKIFLYLVVALGLGALVAPPIFWAGQALASSGTSTWLAGFPFHRVLSRCLQVSTIVLLWPALRWIGLRSRAELNLRTNPLAVADVVVGFVLSAGIVALLTAIYLLGGMFVFRPEADWTGLGRIIPTAIVVSIVEETVFRGVVLGICLWTLPRTGAIAVTTLFFAVVHFLKPAKSALPPDAVRWWSGLVEATNFAPGLPDGWLLFFGLASLFVAGWILGKASVRTHSLWLPIGLHAGWVLAQQTSNLFLRPAPEDASSLLPWAGPNVVSGAVPTGLLPLAALILTAFLVDLYLRYVFRPHAGRDF